MGDGWDREVLQEEGTVLGERSGLSRTFFREASVILILTVKCEWHLVTKVKANTPGMCLSSRKRFGYLGSLG